MNDLVNLLRFNENKLENKNRIKKSWLSSTETLSTSVNRETSTRDSEPSVIDCPGTYSV